VSWKGYDDSHDGWQERETFSPGCDALLEEAFRVFRASDAAADAAAASPTAKKRKRVQQQRGGGGGGDGQPASKRVASAAAAVVVVVVPPPAHVGVSTKGLQWRVRRRGPITPPSNPGLRMGVLEAGMSEEEEEEIATGWGLGAGGAGAGGYVPPLSGSQEF
jgi:hypothetical protein